MVFTRYVQLCINQKTVIYFLAKAKNMKVQVKCAVCLFLLFTEKCLSISVESLYVPLLYLSNTRLYCMNCRIWQTIHFSKNNVQSRAFYKYFKQEINYIGGTELNQRVKTIHTYDIRFPIKVLTFSIEIFS